MMTLCISCIDQNFGIEFVFVELLSDRCHYKEIIRYFNNMVYVIWHGLWNDIAAKI